MLNFRYPEGSVPNEKNITLRGRNIKQRQVWIAIYHKCDCAGRIVTLSRSGPVGSELNFHFCGVRYRSVEFGSRSGCLMIKRTPIGGRSHQIAHLRSEPLEVGNWFEQFIDLLFELPNLAGQQTIENWQLVLNREIGLSCLLLLSWSVIEMPEAICGDLHPFALTKRWPCPMLPRSPHRAR